MSSEWSSGTLLGRNAWHGMATVVQEPPTSVAEVITWFGAPDDTIKLPVFAQLPDGSYVEAESYSAIYSPAADNLFQIAGKDYSVIRKYDLIEMMLAIQDLSSEEFDTIAHVTGKPPVVVESAISLRNNAVFAITAKLGDDISLADGSSHVGLHVVGRSSDDGSLALGASVTGIVAECMNTVVAGMQSAKSSWSIKHTKNAKSRIDEARKALGIVSKYRESFAQTADMLVQTPMPRATFEDMIRDLYPRKGTDDNMTAAPFSQEQYALLGVLDRSATINDAWRDTRWGGLNAVTEYETWLRKMNDTSRDESERRLESDLWGRGAKNGGAAFTWLTRDLVTA